MFLACKTQDDVEQTCFLTYLDDAAATNDAYYTCGAAANADPPTCTADLQAGNATNYDALNTCGGLGCDADWATCMQASPNIACYDTLESCGGWLSSALVADCEGDHGTCGDSAACSDKFYACVRYAAGG